MRLKEQDILLCYPTLESKMQIILLETLNKLGKAGEVVSVKDGFANNYLIPQKKAIIANKKNMKELNSRMSQINVNNDKKIREANELKSKLDEKEIKIQMEANEDGNLYGNITLRQIIEKIKEDFSVELDPASINIKAIKELGDHTITLRLYDEVSATLKLQVAKKS